MHRESYGPKFRQIRRQKGLSIVEAAAGIVSKSGLARWETGQGSLSFEQVLSLLVENNIQPIEFIQKNIFPDLDTIVQTVNQAHDSNEVAILKEHAVKAVANYQLNPQDKANLFKAAIACNYYQDLTAENLFPEIAQLKLKLYFSKIVAENNYWGFESIFFFVNTALLFEPADVSSYAEDLILFIKDENLSANDWYPYIINGLLNLVFALIKKDPKPAHKLLSTISKLKNIDYYSLAKIRIKFMHCLLNYIDDKNEIQVQKIFADLDFFGMQPLNKQFHRAFSQIKSIYED